MAKYSPLAERYGVELCTGECLRKGHGDGFVLEGRIHFRDRRVARPGLRRFLMLVHDLKLKDGWPELLGRKIEEARWIHSRNTFAYREALKLGVRLPRSMSATDRARVMQLLVGQGGPPVVTALRNWAREG